jgi:hypothetical protein
VCGGFAQYLDSPQGRRWFRSSISDFIFPNTSEYNSSYATDLALDIMEGYEYKYDKRAANKVARATTIAELKDFVQATVTNKPPLIWAVSSLPEHEMQAAVTQSSLYKYYADL